MENSALSLVNVSKYFYANGQHIQALDKISFTLKPGQVTGLIGPDAAGKTTLIRLIAGLLLPDEGQINVMGLNVTKQPLQVQSSIGYMPQRFGLYEDLTVQENFDLYADLQNVSLTDRKVRFKELTQLTGLSPFTNRLAGNLSGGMKQKLGLACTLIKLPRLLLLDEATVGVDPVSRRELWSIVYQQVQQHQMTVLLATAYLDEAERCNEVVLLHEGKLIKQDKPQHFSEHVDGRVFYVTVKDVSARSLQAQLTKADSVLDALVESEAVRIITETANTPKPEILLPNYKNVSISVAQPHFEDAFIALLKTKPQHTATKQVADLVKKDINPNDVIIEVHDLVRQFGDFTAVKNINFSVKRGEIFGLLGANGAGKSTTFRMLCGLLPVSSGHIAIAGKDLRKAAASARARLGYMAQKFSLYSHLSVQQNLQFFSSAYGLRNTQQKQRIEWALRTFELEDYTNSNAGDLPLGFKQRLSFATALMHDPDILFLDEPTSGVDPLARREFWDRTNMLAENGVTILVTTHFMEEANYCDRLVIMASGEILAMGTPLSLRQQVRSESNPNPTMEDAFISLIEQKKLQ
jgi:ABC-2 type transport system ATP-binding protein